jgi:hypothetical protein
VLLNRTPSSQEIANQLSSGATNQQLAQGLLQSQEFRTDLVTLYYRVLMHRTASAFEINNWVFSGFDAHSIRVQFEVQPEFFTNG